MAGSAAAAPTPADLEASFARYQWDETAQIAFEILQRDPASGAAKIKGAYALFQRGFTNAALQYLRRLSADEWARLPQGQDRFVEIVTLFQKKVPISVLPGRLEQTSLDRVSPYLRDELRYAKGRDLLDRRRFAEAKELLDAVSRTSRFYSQARYHLAGIAVRSGDYETANRELSRIFEPAVLSQTSEFWKDMSTQVTSHWGSSVKVMLDTEPLLREKTVGELAILAFARTAYARRQFDTAISYYDRLPPDSKFGARAHLEKIWTLLQMEKNDAAQSEALKLSGDERHFESIEARPVRALILADSGRTAEARDEIDRFFAFYEKSRDALERYLKYKDPGSLPEFVNADLKAEIPLEQHRDYQATLREEIQSLKAQDASLFPVYRTLAQELEPLVGRSNAEIGKITEAKAVRRIADLERLALQAKLIRAETWLEDRERLRAEFRDVKAPTEAQQRDHDERLVALLSKAVDETEGAFKLTKVRQPNLEFRQAELLWELATARAIVAQAQNKRKEMDEADRLKRRALAGAENVAATFPQFKKRADALFFTGFAELEMERDADGIRTLERYLAGYPDDFHAPDALRILADARFDRNDFAGAVAYYRRILTFSDSPVAGYALYKIGWSEYNLHNYARALLALEKAISWANESARAEGALNLTRESRHDLISIYAEFGDHRKAYEYLKLVFGDKALEALIDLAKEMDRNGQFEKSGDIYRQLIAMRPSAPENLGFQAGIVRGAFKLRRWSQVDRDGAELVDRFRDAIGKPAAEGTPAWQGEAVLRETALAQHFEFKRTATPEDVLRIIHLDRTYLAGFGDWPGAPEVSDELAHYLLDNGKKRESADAFKAHWLRYQGVIKGPAREEALRNLLYTLEKIESDNKPAAEISPAGNDILAFSPQYEKEYPATKYTRPIVALRAAVLFKYEKLDQGMAESQRLLDLGANDEPGRNAFKNLRLAYYKKKNWKETNDWAARMQSRTEMASYASDLRAIRGESAFLYAEGIDDNNAAAAEYLKIAGDKELDWLHDKALYNAFVRLDKAGRKAEAVEVSARLAAKSPQFGGLKQASGLRSALYQEAGDYERALPLLADFLRNHDKEVSQDTIEQARLNAGLIVEALGDSAAAAAYFNRYLEPSEKPTRGGAEEAKRALDRLSRRNRAPAAQPSSWAGLEKSRGEFEKQPVPKGKDLAKRIQTGGTRLEAITKRFLAVATDKDTPPRYAYEAYCAVPFLYEAYGNGITALGKGGYAEVKAELDKIAQPLAAKAAELGAECLKRSADAEHDGPLYRRAGDRWGWQAGADRKKAVLRALAALEKGQPWLDPAPFAAGEAELIGLHLKNQGSPDTWYSLARRRFEAGKLGLARLTLIDALTRSPDSGRVINALGVIEMRQAEPKGLVGLFEKAAGSGSIVARVNLGLYHLRAARLEAASPSLREALDKGAFGSNEELKRLVKEVTSL